MSGEIAIAAIDEYDDNDPEFASTNTYVVVGIFDTENNFDLTVAYGPFDSIDAASDYGTRNYSFSWVCELVNVDGHTNHHVVVDPNQSTISDYIDPSVVE